MGLVELLEQRLRIRLIAKLGSVSRQHLEIELQQQREVLVELLIRFLDTVERPAPPTASASPTGAPTVPGVKEQPTPEILDRAAKLQALAMGSPEEHERAAAWLQFERLWQKYHLPTNLGM